MKCTVFPTVFTTNTGLLLCFLKDRMLCFSTFVEVPACQQQAKEKLFKWCVNRKISTRNLYLKLKGIIYSVLSREDKTTNQLEEKKKISRKAANKNRQLFREKGKVYQSLKLHKGTEEEKLL